MTLGDLRKLIKEAEEVYNLPDSTLLIAHYRKLSGYTNEIDVNVIPPEEMESMRTDKHDSAEFVFEVGDSPAVIEFTVG